MDIKTKLKLRSFFKKESLVKKHKGEILFAPGDKIKNILLSRNGYVKIYELNKNGEQLVLPVLNPLLLLTLIDCFTTRKNTYFVEAVTNVEYWELSKEDFVQYLEKDKELKTKIIKYVLSNLSDILCNYKSLVFGNAKVKITTLILSLVKSFGRKKGQKIELKFNVSHKMLASMTGLSRETVTLQMLQLQKEKIISYQGRKMIINNLDKLTNCKNL
jgi:CRP/FNR family transcriptional regulator, cyclic AMP receptor protein